MKKKLLEYWVLIEKHATICLILDPRFKCDFITNKEDKKKAVNIFENLFHEYKANTNLSRQNSCESSTSGILI